MTKTNTRPRHKRRLRNLLLDVGLQLRYTVFILGVAVFLMALLGYRVYVATQETSRMVTMTASVDPSLEQELRSQFRANDRVVVWGMVGFGLVLVLAVSAAGIWMTHKIAGPLYNIGSAMGRIREGKLPAGSEQLRKGDQLQDFHAGFREMCDALRARTSADCETLGNAIAAIEAQASRTPQLERALAELRELRRSKEQGLAPS
jgi:nitrogen fixation/metabolism regulation signal transduction histidine kinase